MPCSRMTTVGVLAATVVLAGCGAQFREQNALLRMENEELRVQLSDCNTLLTQAEIEMDSTNLQLNRLQRDVAQAPVAQVTGFEQIPNVTAEYGRGEVTVAVESDVLFRSGDTKLRQGAKASLDQVASVLNRSYAGRPIRIEGHTDRDPIRKSGFKSNHHLGFERAYAVRDYLAANGVESPRISVASYGADRPRATKSESRRVEIVVLVD